MAAKSEVKYIRYYTAGSAAREIAPLAPQRTQPVPKVRKARKILIYIDPVAIVGVVTAVFMMICMAIGLVRLNSLQAQAAAMNDYVLQLEMENADMDRQYHESYNLADIEQTAIALGMVPAQQVTHINLAD